MLDGLFVISKLFFLCEKKADSFIDLLLFVCLFELLLCFRTKQGARLSVVTIISPLICICEDWLQGLLCGLNELVIKAFNVGPGTGFSSPHGSNPGGTKELS